MAKRKREAQLFELTFDSAARQEYLTGFHKRKQVRIHTARKLAAKAEKEERLRDRRQRREHRKEELERHVREVDAEVRKQNGLHESESEVDGEGGGDEWEGFDEARREDAGREEVQQQQEEEFVDEAAYTTVTVEAMDPSGPADIEDDINGKSGTHAVPTAEAGVDTSAERKRARSSDMRENGKAKRKKKKFRYESKAERAAGRQKQKAKNHAAKAKRKGE